MRKFFAIACAIIALGAPVAHAEERSSLSASQALDLCDRWFAGTLAAPDVQLQGWRTALDDERVLVVTPIPPSSGAMRELQFHRLDYPTIETRSCFISWRFNESQDHLNETASALSVRGFETQISQSAAGEGTVVASKLAEGMATARAQMVTEPCEDIIIGPLRENCTQESVSQMNLYVSLTRPISR